MTECTLSLTRAGIRGCGISITDKGIAIGGRVLDAVHITAPGGLPLDLSGLHLSTARLVLWFFTGCIAIGIITALTLAAIALTCWIVWMLAKLPVALANRRGLHWEKWIIWVSVAAILTGFWCWILMVLLACFLPPRRRDSGSGIYGGGRNPFASASSGISDIASSISGQPQGGDDDGHPMDEWAADTEGMAELQEDDSTPPIIEDRAGMLEAPNDLKWPQPHSSPYEEDYSNPLPYAD